MKIKISAFFLAGWFALLLHAQPPTARWITAQAPDPDRPNTWIAFRKDIQVVKRPATAIARIAADSKYWLWVNGQLAVFEGGLKRGPTPNDTYYDEVDLALYLTKGTNRIAILLWHFGKEGFSHKNSGKAGLIFSLDDKDLHVGSDSSWLSRIHPAYEDTDAPHPNWRLPESNIRFVATRDITGWQTGDNLTAYHFQPSAEIGEAGDAPWNRLVKRPIPFWKDFGIHTLTFTRHETDSTVTYTARLPYNLQMTPIIELEAKTGGDTLRIETDHLYGGSSTNLRAEYVTRPGKQAYESLGWLNGETLFIRHNKNADLCIRNIAYRETGYDAEPAGNFHCDNPFVLNFWQKALRTLYVNMRDTYFDCPDRERAQWWGDVVTLMGESFYTYSTSTHLLMRKAIRELVDWQRPDKTLFAPIPAGNYSTELPAQMLAAIGMYGFWNYYLNTGDEETLRYAYPHVRDYLSIWQLDETGLTAYRSGEWAWGDWGNHIDMRLLLAAWHSLALEAAVHMARLWDYEADAAGYEQTRAQIKEAYNRCWNGYAYRHPQYQQETDDRVQALAVLAGIAEESQYDRIFHLLKTQWHASPYMEKYVMEALFRMGRGDYALERMEKRFADMVNDTTHTTLFEDWSIGGSGGGSTNHAWSGGGLTVIAQYVCGVRPLEAGYKHFLVAPTPATFKQAAIEVPTVRGMVKSAFECETGTFTLTLNVPKDTEATVVLPPFVRGEVSLNGRDVPQRYKTASTPDNRLQYRLPAGSYCFRCKLD